MEDLTLTLAMGTPRAPATVPAIKRQVSMARPMSLHLTMSNIMTLEMEESLMVHHLERAAWQMTKDNHVENQESLQGKTDFISCH